MKKLGRKKKLSKEVKRLAKILNSNPDLIASASNRKFLKLKKKNKKEFKPPEYGMRLRHQKFTLAETEIACEQSVKDSSTDISKLEGNSSTPETKPSEETDSCTSSKSLAEKKTPSLVVAAKAESTPEKNEEHMDPPLLQAQDSESKEESENNNWRSLPRRAKRPAPTSPLKKPPKKRGRPKASETIVHPADLDNSPSISDEKTDMEVSKTDDPEAKSFVDEATVNSDDTTGLSTNNESSNSDDTLPSSPNGYEDESLIPEPASALDNPDLPEEKESKLVDERDTETPPCEGGSAQENSTVDMEANDVADVTSNNATDESVSSQNSHSSESSRPSKEVTFENSEQTQSSNEEPMSQSNLSQTEELESNSTTNVDAGNETVVLSSENCNNCESSKVVDASTTEDSEVPCEVEPMKDLSDSEQFSDNIAENGRPFSDSNGDLAQSSPLPLNNIAECPNDVKLLVSSMCDNIDHNAASKDELTSASQASPAQESEEESHMDPNTDNGVSEDREMSNNDSNDVPKKDVAVHESNFNPCMTSTGYTNNNNCNLSSNYLPPTDETPNVNQLPPTPQTPISDHGINHHSIVNGASGDEGHSSSEGELTNSENVVSPPSMNKQRLYPYKTDMIYSQYEQEMHSEFESRSSPNDSVPGSNQCYTRPPSVSTPVLLRKNTPTPDMSHLGVYTPDSSTNSGFTSGDHMNLESPSSLNSNDMPQPRSVEPSPPTSTPPQPYMETMHASDNSYCSSKREPALKVPNTKEMNLVPLGKPSNCTTSMNQMPSHHIHPQHHRHQVNHMHHQPDTSYSQHPASAALSSMVSNNSVGALLLGQGSTVAPTNNYINTVNIGMSSTTPSPHPVGGSYMVGVPLTSVIQPQSSSVSHHQQPSNQASHGSMQRLSHISMPITTSSCGSSSHAFHMQTPNYTYSNAATPNRSTSCSLAKLQQLTNGIVEITPNQITGYPTMTPPPSYNSPTHQSSHTPPPQMQRPIAPAITNLQAQPPLSTNQVHGYANYANRYHPRDTMQRTSNIAISPNLVASYQTLNGVGYRMQQASPLGGNATLLNTTGYITNAGFINPPSPAMPMGVVNMHPQAQYQDTMQQVRPQSTMYAYSYHINGGLPPQALMRR